MTGTEVGFLEVKGRRIAEDEHGYVCLNDLWAMAGSPETQRPHDWRATRDSKELIAAVARRVVAGISGNKPETPMESMCFVVGRGRTKRTFAHPNVALGYAKYLSPDLAAEVNDVFLRYRRGDATLAKEIMERNHGAVSHQASIEELTDAIGVAKRVIAEQTKMLQLSQSSHALLIGYATQAADDADKRKTADAELDLERQRHGWTQARLAESIRDKEAVDARIKNAEREYRKLRTDIRGRLKSAKAQGFEEGVRHREELRYPELRKENEELREEIRRVLEEWRVDNSRRYALRRKAIERLDAKLSAEVEAEDTAARERARQRFEVVDGDKT